MKRISIHLLTNVLLMLVGILLIIFYTIPDVLQWVAVVIGVLFLLPSMAYLVAVALRKAEVRSQSDMLGILPAVGGMCFGVIMMWNNPRITMSTPSSSVITFSNK